MNTGAGAESVRLGEMQRLAALRRTPTIAIAGAKMVRVCEMQRGEYGVTRSGQFLRSFEAYFHDELGRHTYPNDYDEPVTLLDEWPKLMAGDRFRLMHKPQLMPASTLLCAREDNGFRFRLVMSGHCTYRLSIPFWFRTIDPRVPLAQAAWKTDSGKAWDLMWQASKVPLGAMYITYDDNQIVLHVDAMTKWYEVPSI